MRKLWRLPNLLTVVFALLATSAARAEDYGHSEALFEEDAAETQIEPLPLEEFLDSEEQSLVPEMIPLESAPHAGRPTMRGPGGPGMGGGPGGGPGYSVVWYPSRSVSGQQGDLAVLRQNLSGGLPLWMNEGRALMFNFNVRNSLYSGEVTLPDTGRPFPAELWDVSFGVNYLHQFDNDWTGLLMVSAGTSGDEPFQSGDEINIMLGGMLLIPARNQRDSWTLGVMYSPAGTLNFPIPMVAYSWNPSESFQMNLGLPFRLHWEPGSDWAIDLSYVPLTNVNARLTYLIHDRMQLYGAYENLSEAYFLSDRVNSEDRFFVFEQRLVMGMKCDIGRHLSAELNSGYAFEREFGEGENQGAGLHDKVRLSPGVFLGLNLRFEF